MSSCRRTLQNGSIFSRDEISVEQLQSLKDKFADGNLSEQEFVNLFRDIIDPSLNESQLGELYQKIDANSDGTVDWDGLTNYRFLSGSDRNAEFIGTDSITYYDTYQPEATGNHISNNHTPSMVKSNEKLLSGDSESDAHIPLQTERLLDITPDDVARYVNTKAFGKEFPIEGDFRIHARSNTLKAIKKRLSKFMPRRNIVWDEIKQEGNPTRSQQVNEVIQTVMKMEARKLGKPPLARRPITMDEFLSVIRICRATKQYQLISVITLQWHLIGRVDNMMKLRVSDISPSIDHPFALNLQMRWSKNIQEERESARQILLASLDDRLCVILNLAIFIECDGTHYNLTEFLFLEGDLGNQKVRYGLSSVLNSPEFERAATSPLGSHSIRKGPATYCVRSGISRDSIKLRGRWRNNVRQVDTYMDITRPYPDAQVASCLCGPSGPIKYVISKEASWVSNEFLQEKVVPISTRTFGQVVARVLGLALLWAVFQGFHQ